MHLTLKTGVVSTTSPSLMLYSTTLPIAFKYAVNPGASS